MGIIDTILGFFKQEEKGTSPKSMISEAKEAAGKQNFNMASIKTFYALELMGESYAATKRSPHKTAREYAEELAEGGVVTTEELEPIILNFEVAKYSELEVSSEAYSAAEEALTTTGTKLRKGGAASGRKKKRGRRRRRRRKPRRGGKTGAAKRRKRKKKE